MKKQLIASALSLLAFASMVPAGVAGPAETPVVVLSAGAAKVAVLRLSEVLRQREGIGARLQFDTVGAILKRLEAGESPDVVIVTAEAAKTLREKGRLAGEAKALGKVRIGVCAKEGAAKPDLSSPEAFKKTLLKAKSVAYVDPAKGATSGIHFAKVLEKLGIAQAMASKTVLVASGSSAEKVVSGEAELCVQQVTEILPCKGAKLVGLLPDSLQKTTTYSAAVMAKAAHAERARRFVEYLAGAAGRIEFGKAGFSR